MACPDDIAIMIKESKLRMPGHNLDHPDMEMPFEIQHKIFAFARSTVARKFDQFFRKHIPEMAVEISWVCGRMSLWTNIKIRFVDDHETLSKLKTINHDFDPQEYKEIVDSLMHMRDIITHYAQEIFKCQIHLWHTWRCYEARSAARRRWRLLHTGNPNYGMDSRKSTGLA